MQSGGAVERRDGADVDQPAPSWRPSPPMGAGASESDFLTKLNPDAVLSSLSAALESARSFLTKRMGGRRQYQGRGRPERSMMTRRPPFCSTRLESAKLCPAQTVPERLSVEPDARRD